MNNVIITGYFKKKSELKKTKNGKDYYKNTLVVPSDNNKGNDWIDFLAFGNEAIALDKINAGVTIELRGRLHSSWQNEKRYNEVTVFVDKVVATNNIQDEEAFMDNDMSQIEEDVPVGEADDDLPF